MEAAAIIATVRATTSTAIQARTLCVIWKDAPRDVYLLRDELDTCKSFLDSLESGIISSESAFLVDSSSHDHGRRTKAALRALLLRATDVARSLGEILVEIIGEPEDSASTTSTIHAEDDSTSGGARKTTGERLGKRKKLLWLRRIESVTKLRKLLRQTTDDIALHLTMLNIQITTVNTRIDPSPSITNKSLEESANSIVSQLTKRIESSSTTLEERIHSQINRRLDESFSAMSARLEDSLGDHRAALEDLVVATNKISLNREAAASSTVNHHTRTTTINYHRVPASYQMPRCECPCHSYQQTNKTSTSRWELAWLHNVLGSLRMSYTTTSQRDSSSHQNCRLCTCADFNHRQDQTSVVLQWRLPPWLARAIISTYFLQRDRPELLIRVHRIISTETASYSQSIIGRVHANDLEGVKSLIVSCPASIHDVDPSGNSALLFAAGFRQVPMVKFLLQAGADPFQESSGRNTLSPARYALMLSLRSRTTTTSTESDTPEDQIASMMPLSTILDEDEYTDLHRVIIGVLPLDLSTALMSPLFRAQINHKTTTGMTPLHLAARDCSTGTETKFLLAAGADPNAVANDGTTPLHNACRGGNEEAVSALLAAGASPQLSTQRHYLHETLIHAVAQAQNSQGNACVKILDMILAPEHGLDINAVDDMGSTALGIAAEFNRIMVVRHLIVNGAGMDTVDGDGDTPLMNATTHRAHGAVRLLLGLRFPETDDISHTAGSDKSASFKVQGVEERYRAINHLRGWGILHYIADFGDKEMMEIFAELKMTGLPDPQTFKDLQGRTAGDIFNARIMRYNTAGNSAEEGDGDTENADELVVAWENLLRSINRCQSPTDTGEGTRKGMMGDDATKPATGKHAVLIGGGGNAHSGCEEEDNGADSSDDEFFDVLESWE